MNSYLVRTINDINGRSFVGFYCAEDSSELFQRVDIELDPNSCEYAENVPFFVLFEFNNDKDELKDSNDNSYFKDTLNDPDFEWHEFTSEDAVI